MGTPPWHNPKLPNGTTAVQPEKEDPSSSHTIESPQSSTNITKRKNKKKKKILISDSASSNNCSCSQKGLKISRSPKGIRVGSLTKTRRSVGLSDVDALGLLLGMSIAAVVAQVLERNSAAAEKLSVDNLSGICILAVRESLGNVFGDKFDNFLTNFETSFRSTLMTLRLISGSSQNDGEQFQRGSVRGYSCSETSYLPPSDTLKDSARPSECESLPHISSTEQQRAKGQNSSFDASTLSSHDRTEGSRCTSGDTYGPDRTSKNGQCHTHWQTGENVKMSPMNRQLVLHDNPMEQQLACASPRTSSSNSTIEQFSRLSTIEKSVIEQARSNDLKTFAIGLKMKKLQLKERQLELSTNSNLLERWKLSMGFSKASFKEEKFKTQLQDSKQVELLKNCLDFLVGGLIIMLSSIAYGTYVYSHRRIIEATEACSPYKIVTGIRTYPGLIVFNQESNSWWMPKSMATFNSGLQLVTCQIQVLSRRFFGILMIGAIAVLLFKRSVASSHHTMPITFILLLLGVGCGYAGKFCIDTLGGSGNRWLIYWEALCALHFFSSIFYSTLFTILNGPITVTRQVELNPVIPYWMRKFAFYATLLFLPLLCGFLPFASTGEWFDHFSDLLTFEDD